MAHFSGRPCVRLQHSPVPVLGTAFTCSRPLVLLADGQVFTLLLLQELCLHPLPFLVRLLLRILRPGMLFVLTLSFNNHKVCDVRLHRKKKEDPVIEPSILVGQSRSRRNHVFKETPYWLPDSFVFSICTGPTAKKGRHFIFFYFYFLTRRVLQRLVSVSIPGLCQVVTLFLGSVNTLASIERFKLELRSKETYVLTS